MIPHFKGLGMAKPSGGRKESRPLYPKSSEVLQITINRMNEIFPIKFNFDLMIL